MSANDVYSNVNLKAKKKTNVALAEDEDYIDYSLIDFTTSGNKRRRSKAASSETVTYSTVRIPQPGTSTQQEKRHDDDSDDSDYSFFEFNPSGNNQAYLSSAANSETVTYSGVKIPQPGTSKQPVKRDEGANGDDAIYYKITKPQRDAAQNNEPLTQSVHTPVVSTTQSDFALAMAMTPVREIKQRLFMSARFLQCLNMFFLVLAVIVGILFSLEKKAHKDTMGRYEMLQSKHNAVQEEFDRSHRNLSVVLQSLMDLNISYARMHREKTSLQRDLNVSLEQLRAEKDSLSKQSTSLQNELKGVRLDLERETDKNQQLTREKQTKDKELRDKQTELRKRDTTISQLNQNNTDVRQKLEDTKKILDAQIRSNVLFSQINKSITEELRKYRDTPRKTGTEAANQEKSLLDRVLQVLETGCDFIWKRASEKCFFFSSAKNTWNESRDACQAKGGQLAITDTERTWNLLRTNIPGSDTSTFYWIGLTDLEVENDWRWVDNTPVSFKKWFRNQPDNWTNSSKRPEGEDCARMNAKEGLWMDAFCDEQLQYICETTAAV